VATTGIELRRGHGWLRATVELLSSMRFAISLLTVICIASVIGTVLKQHEPPVNYVNQFGPFWAELFAALSLNTVYSAGWFLLILAFLVVSTSLCIARNTPKILVELKTYKEGVRETSLKAFRHRGEARLAESRDEALARVTGTLLAQGWKIKAQVREASANGQGGVMVAAKKGAANKLGYLAAHSAIVLVCVGGLLDGDWIVKAQLWLQGKTPYGGSGLISDVPAQHRLPVNNPTFRGNLLVPEGGRATAAVLNMPTGVVIQDLPFSIELKKFVVDYYSTGMPKLFASDIVIRDRETGQEIPARVEVNKPAAYKGIHIYQSSFDDGGSKLKVAVHPLVGGGKAFELAGEVGQTAALSNGREKLQLEYSGLRVINVENLSQPGAATDVRKVDLRTSVLESMNEHLGSGAKSERTKNLRNVGPSFSYKLRDEAGQAREYNNYMLATEVDGQRVFLAGVRDTPSETFRYLRIPADDQDSMDGWLRLKAALANDAMRNEAVRRYAAAAVADRQDLRAQLEASAARGMALFAGVGEGASEKDQPPEARLGGLQAIADFMERSVPEAERERASGVLVRIINGVMWELLGLTRHQAGLKPLPEDDKTRDFITASVLALSDSFFYPAPVLLQLKEFTQVQASVFQVARAPGKWIVYLGCLALILGVFAMLYVRERRIWVWLENAPPGDGAAATRASLALSTNRCTLDGDAEFEALKKQLLRLT
jgi:cytochrome c biogenesis protein